MNRVSSFLVSLGFLSVNDLFGRIVLLSPLPILNPSLLDGTVGECDSAR